MILQLLAALVGAVFFPHGQGPDSARNTAQDRVFGIHAVAKEKRQVGCEIIDTHSAGEVGLNVGKRIRKREGQLRNGVGPRFGDVVAGN